MQKLISRIILLSCIALVSIHSPATQAQNKNPFADFNTSSSRSSDSASNLLPLHPSGAVGLFHTFSALQQPSSPKSFGMGFISNYYVSKKFPQPPSIVERFMGAIQLNYAPIKYLELFGNVSMVKTNSEPPDNPLIQQIPNIDFGFKVALPIGQKISLGAVYNGGYRASTSEILNSNTAINHDVRLITTYDLTQNTPIRFHVNLGYAINNNARVTNASIDLREIHILRAYPGNAIMIAAGLEYLTTRASFSLEYSIDHLQGAAGYGFTDHPQRVTLGVRFFPTDDQAFSITTGVDLGGFATDPALGGYVEPKYAAYLGLAYLFGTSASGSSANFDMPSNVFGKTEVPQSTSISPSTKIGVGGGVLGFVSNIETGAPISGATITFCNQSQIISDAQGQFKAADLPEGPCGIKLEHPAHQPMNDQVNIIGGVDNPFDFSMLSSQTITPVDAPIAATQAETALLVAVQNANREGVQADIRLENNPSHPPLQTDEFGKGTFALPPGQYALFAKTNQGEESSTKYLLLKEGDQTFVEFTVGRRQQSKVKISKDKKTITIADKIQFEVGKAMLTFNSTKLLDEIAALLTSQSNIERVKIAGHTDNTGNAGINLKISQQRADAVRDYLIKKGIDPTRLEAAGYGEDFPIATNATENGRYENRRVEFRILNIKP